MQLHPLTALRPEELPGFIACASLVRDALADPPVLESYVAARFLELQEIAEGLLAKAGAEEEVGGYYLAGDDPAENYEGIQELLTERSVGNYVPVEVLRVRSPYVQWVVRTPIGRDGDWEWTSYGTRHQALQICTEAQAEESATSACAAEAVVARGFVASQSRENTDRITAALAEMRAVNTGLGADIAALAAPPPAPAPLPPAASTSVVVFTPERLALIRRLWPTNSGASVARILAEINALPGRPCSSEASLSAKARELGLRRRPELDPDAPPSKPDTRSKSDAPRPADADPADPADFSTEDLREAREMLDKGADGRGLHEYFGGELAFWAAFATNYREQKARV